MRLTLFTGALAVASVAAASRTDVWQGFEERAQGAAARWRGPAAWPDELVVIAIDDATLERHGWPMPRDALALVVALAAKSGARAVGVDAYLMDPTNNDEALAAVGRAWPHLVLGAECVPSSWKPGPRLECSRFNLPAGPLATAATLAHLNARPGHSGTMRALWAQAHGEKRTMSALSLAVYQSGGGEVPELPSVLIASWRGVATPVSMNDVLDEATRSGVDAPTAALQKLFHGKWVLIGQTAASIGDHGPLFTGEVRPLVNLHAAMLADFIEHRMLRAPPATEAVGFAVLFGVVALLAAALSRPSLAAGVLLVCLGMIGGAAYASPLFQPVGPVAAALLGFAATLTVRVAAQDRERRLLRAAFGAYLDEQLLERILDDPKTFLQLGGARKRLTVLFSDIRGYTGLSNERPAEEVVQLLREYLDVMTRLVKSHQGRVDKIMGDGILAVFGDPVPLPNHAERSIEVALAMQDEVGRLSRRWESEGRSAVAIRIGIATGDVFVGNIGSSAAKIEYTVLGPTVNLASRLEGRAPPGGVLVSADTYQECKARFDLQSVGALALKGFQDVRAAYLVLGPKLSTDPERASPRLRARAEVQVRRATPPNEMRRGVVTDVSAGGMHVASELKVAVGDVIDVELPSSGVLGSVAAVTVRGEVRHASGEGFGLQVQSAGSGDASAVRHFIALYLGPEALHAQVHSSADGYQVDLSQLYRAPHEP